MNTLILNIITIFHILFVAFIVITPFTKHTQMLLLHFIIVPFVMLHWYTNNNTCVLTLMERKIKEKNNIKFDPNDCFTCKIIHPIYDFKKNYKQRSMFIYLITIILWLLTVRALYKKYDTGELCGIMELFYK